MFIDISKIGREGVSFDRSVPVHEVEGPGGETIRVVGATLRGEAIRSGPSADLSGRLEALLEIPCSRCLEPFPWNLTSDFNLRAVTTPENAELSIGVTLDDDEITWSAPGGRIDLVALGTEQIYLGLPLKPICREDCRGLCTECGANLNTVRCSCRVDPIDPRLAPLLEFRKRRDVS